jgi:formiminotetrahydrofolate cyclodeaminase
VKDFDVWLDDMSSKPLPGGVAAAAAAAAMGAALMAKAVRVTLRRQPMLATERGLLENALGLAQEQVATLLELSGADERAFQAVFDLPSQALASPAGRETWLEATTVPVRLAEVCQSLLIKLPRLVDLCWPAVRPDLETGGWLLQAGLHSGLLSAESDLRAIGDGADVRSLHRRLDELQDGRDD